MGFRPAARPGRAWLAGAPLLVAHRGGARLAPENTVDAFRMALDGYHADVLELDCRLTRDGRVAVIHDETVDRTTDGSGPVHEMSARELQQLDAGYRFTDPEGRHSFRNRGVRVPLLDELLEDFPGVRLNVECKCEPVAEPLRELIRSHDAEHRVLVAAEHERSRRAIRDYPGPWGASRSQLWPFHLLHRLPFGFLYTPAVDVLQIPETWNGRTVLTPRLLEEAHRRNIPVQVWTVDEEEDMRRLLAMGVDGIQTDRPDRLARVLHEEYGRPLPPALTGGEPPTP